MLDISDTVTFVIYVGVAHACCQDTCAVCTFKATCQHFVSCEAVMKPHFISTCLLMWSSLHTKVNCLTWSPPGPLGPSLRVKHLCPTSCGKSLRAHATPQPHPGPHQASPTPPSPPLLGVATRWAWPRAGAAPTLLVRANCYMNLLHPSPTLCNTQLWDIVAFHTFSFMKPCEERSFAFGCWSVSETTSYAWVCFTSDLYYMTFFITCIVLTAFHGETRVLLIT